MSTGGNLHLLGGSTLLGLLGKELGVDVVWLSPVYKSPRKDMGYDISDYKDIDPRYGSMQDIENLTDLLHERDMKLVMDLVVNHTSDQVSPAP